MQSRLFLQMVPTLKHLTTGQHLNANNLVIQAGQAYEAHLGPLAQKPLEHLMKDLSSLSTHSLSAFELRPFDGTDNLDLLRSREPVSTHKISQSKKVDLSQTTVRGMKVWISSEARQLEWGVVFATINVDVHGDPLFGGELYPLERLGFSEVALTRRFVFEAQSWREFFEVYGVLGCIGLDNAETSLSNCGGEWSSAIFVRAREIPAEPWKTFEWSSQGRASRPNNVNDVHSRNLLSICLSHFTDVVRQFSQITAS